MQQAQGLVFKQMVGGGEVVKKSGVLGGDEKRLGRRKNRLLISWKRFLPAAALAS